MNLASQPLFDELKDSKNIFIAGAGGGFDVFSGLPVYFSLRKHGKKVFLANLSFSNLSEATGVQLTSSALLVNADSRIGDESDFGIPQEDMVSIAAVNALAIEKILLLSLHRQIMRLEKLSVNSALILYC
ncbi:hypothetical protein [Candidatus Electronema sp. JM]|uniref:hypothetical protein n=1 Tax=Candidatus Electronema sp. JM TaxID=3401571 RepID=UPI003AA7D69F